MVAWASSAVVVASPPASPPLRLELRTFGAGFGVRGFGARLPAGITFGPLTVFWLFGRLLILCLLRLPLQVLCQPYGCGDTRMAAGATGVNGPVDVVTVNCTLTCGSMPMYPGTSPGSGMRPISVVAIS